jgi:hypothetical protein
MPQNSGVKKLLLEVGFLLGVLLAVILTAVDIILGIGRYLIGRARGRSHFNPWKNIQALWRMIGLHLLYLFNLIRPSFRESLRRNRETMHRRAVTLRESFKRTGDIGVFRELEYADGVDVAMFFAIVPYGIIGSIILVQAVTATVTVISLYGVYKVYHPTATLRTAPEQQTVVTYQPQVADQQETDFGPTWLDRGSVFGKVNDPEFKSVALLSDTGSIKYSATKVVESAGFTPLAWSERVSNPSPTSTGQIHFSDQTGHEFTVNKEQAFMFEGYSSKMFMFDTNGKLMAVDPKAAKLR